MFDGTCIPASALTTWGLELDGDMAGKTAQALSRCTYMLDILYRRTKVGYQMSRLPHVFKSWRGSHRLKVLNEGIQVGKKVSIICRSIRCAVLAVVLSFRFCM